MTEITTTVETSNSLAVLAARIRAEHEAGTLAIKRGLAHVISAGKMLNEAKAQLPHGGWLPWLRDHCQVPERTARDYMHLARHAAEPKSAISADLTGSVKSLTPPDALTNDSDWDDISAWAQWQLERPFSNFDFEPLDLGWVGRKILHKVRLPWTVAYCFDVLHDMEEALPTLRLCPYDDLGDAVEALAPIINDQRALPFDGESFDSMYAMRSAVGIVEVETMWMLGGLLTEIKYREHLTDERYEIEWEQTHRELMARLEATLADFRQQREKSAEAASQHDGEADTP